MFLFLVASLLVPLVAASGEGNLHLMEEEIAEALRNCASKPGHSASIRTRRDIYRTGQQNHNNYNRNGQNNGDNDNTNDKQNANPNDNTGYGLNATSTRVDNATQTHNPYGHERRNISEIRINALNNSQPLAGDLGQRSTDTSTVSVRNKRGGGGLFANPDSDQCLSQCVFANLQVVDSRGIPREADMWAKVQTSVTSQQSRNALKDQIHACFQELEQEAEDDGCSYSNKLERCLTLRLVERVTQATSSRASSNHSN